MSGPTDLKTTTCPKCRNKNPTEAAFCGFCGGDLRAAAAPEKATMFGYAADLGLDQLRQGPAQPVATAGSAAATDPQPATAKAPASTPPVSDEAPTTAYSAGQGYVAGRYWIQQELEALAVGKRVRAQDTKAETLVDVLTIDPAMFPSALDMERARRELRQLQKVSARHVVRVLDHGKADDERLYVVTECVDGQSIAAMVEEGPLALDQVLSIIRDVGAGLAAAQSVGVIHRDVSPNNVVKSADGDAKLRCYGVAPLIKGHVFGTPEFSSPEQAAGRPVDQRSSIYSLGALMFHMLAGRPPFTGDPDQVLKQHQEAELPPLGELRADLAGNTRLQGLLAKAMAKSSSRRHLTLRQFLREVEALGTPATATPTTGNVSNAAPGRIPQPAPQPAPIPLTPARPVAPSPANAPMPAGGPDMAATLIQSEPLVVPDGAADSRGAPSVQPVGGPQPVVVAPAEEQVPGAPVDHGARTMINDLDGKPKDDGVTTNLGPSQAIASVVASAPPAVAPPAVVAASARVATPSAAPAGADDGPSAGERQAAQSSPSVAAGTANTVVGEMQGRARVRLKQTNEQPATRDPSPPQAPATGQPPAPADGRAGRGKGFRETMWFLKGEVESAMAEKGDPGAPEETAPDADELRDKYKDDGTIDDDAARRLSLRTGRTQMMQRAEVPTGNVPGERMRSEDFIDEMNRGRRIGIAIFVGVVALLVVGGLLLIF